MCNFKSAIVTKSGEVYHHPLTDSHNDIIELFNLHNGENPQFTPVELVPDTDCFDVDTYKFRFDAERPGWATDEWVERVTKKMRAIVREMIFTKKAKILVGGAYLLGAGAKVGKIIQGRIVAISKDLNLAYADLAGVNFAHANLAHVNLAYANLAHANLAGVNFAHANLAGVNFAHANLAGVNFAHAYLAYANLAYVNLAGVNLAGAIRYVDAPAGWKIENSFLVKE
jgi:hypothetical protein